VFNLLVDGVMEKHERESLLRTIRNAFQGIEPPGADMIAYQGGWETDSINKDFSELLGGDVDNEIIDGHYDSLPGLSPKAFQYFLPHYLQYSIQHPDSRVAEFVVYHLQARPRADAYWKERKALFSTSQRVAICKFLEYIRGAEAFSLILDVVDDAIAYWSEDF